MSGLIHRMARKVVNFRKSGDTCSTCTIQLILKLCQKNLNIKKTCWILKWACCIFLIVFNPSRYQGEFLLLGELAGKCGVLANFQAEQITAVLSGVQNFSGVLNCEDRQLTA